jgi:TetR/AcrR family transcriptional repressor of nem operon
MAAGRPRIFDTHAVVEKAQDVFWRKGYEAASTEELLSAMGIGRGSFYLEFPDGKKELYGKAIWQFHREAFAEFEKRIDSSQDPVEEIRGFFRNITLGSRKDHKKGCFIGNTIVEMASNDPRLEQEAIRILKEIEKLFCTTIKKCQGNGKLKTKMDAVLLARHLVTLWNGLNITRRMYPDDTVLGPLIEMQLKILE